ncbi:hypothetical protein V8J88_00075 [Massilia sp. W12]|uniref:hypothetical protein n=1 Tax=Massilia sp. W12 TaxID=3126507 RepID=UPI0030CE5465
MSRQRKHQVEQTRDMPGLNKDAALRSERQKWLAGLLQVLQAAPDEADDFLRQAPYRYILATVQG